MMLGGWLGGRGPFEGGEWVRGERGKEERGNEVNVFFLLVYGERKYCGEIPFSFSDFLAFGKGHLKKRTWKKKKKIKFYKLLSLL